MLQEAQFDILQAIVCLVPIDVVNGFAAFEGSAESLGHY
jgi:hypothetical protein